MSYFDVTVGEQDVGYCKATVHLAKFNVAEFQFAEFPNPISFPFCLIPFSANWNSANSKDLLLKAMRWICLKAYL